MSGDAFLKYLSSVYTFVANPSLSEGALHIARQRFISNKSLLLHSTRVGLPEYIQSKVFAYKAWQPPNFYLHIPPKVPKVPDTNNVEGDKISTKEDEDDDQEAAVEESNDVGQSQEVNDSAEDETLPPLDDAAGEKQYLNAEPTGIDTSRAATPIVEDTQDDDVHLTKEPKSTSSKKKGKYRKKKGNAISHDVQWLGDKVNTIYASSCLS